VLNQFVKKVVNVPFVWNALQNVVGANPWKNAIYPSVFDSKGTLLDFGCSIGNGTGSFLDFQYCGVDVDAQAIAAARIRWRNHPNIRFECVDILRQPFGRDSFDHVLFACTAHHLADEYIAPTLDALLACLKPGGRLHFFDVIRQPGKDRFITRLIMHNDQGKHMRTKVDYESIFGAYRDCVAEQRLFRSPDRWIKLQDMLYVQLVRYH